MFKLNVIILIVLTALGASILGYFIVKDLRSDAKPLAEKVNETPTLPPVATTPLLDKEGRGAREVAKEEEKPKLPPAPDLNRAIMFKALVREEDKPKIEAEIKIISQTLKDTPDYLQGWLQLGILRKYIGDYEGASEAWEYAVKIRPKDFVAYNNLGDLYHFYLKNFPRSESAIKKVIELRPDYTSAYRNLFELYALSYKEKEGLAAGALMDGISKNPKAYDLMVALAMYYKEKGNRDSARKYLEDAIKLNPPNKSALEAELSGL